jgi:hypothetical protein
MVDPRPDRTFHRSHRRASRRDDRTGGTKRSRAFECTCSSISVTVVRNREYNMPSIKAATQRDSGLYNRL